MTHFDIKIVMVCPDNAAAGIEQEFHLDVLWRDNRFIAINTDKELFEGDKFVGVAKQERAAAMDYISQWVGMT